MVEVQSSNIKAVDYVDNELIVEYLGGHQYKYKGVEKEVYENLLVAESKGRFMNESIKGKYDFEKIS